MINGNWKYVTYLSVTFTQINLLSAVSKTLQLSDVAWLSVTHILSEIKEYQNIYLKEILLRNVWKACIWALPLIYFN